jgi:putative methionine-R-sulfoxide reductase with GAF domain
MTLRKAAEMAWNYFRNAEDITVEGKQVMEALRQALAQPEWVGLTDGEKNELVDAFYGTDIQRLEAVEAKLKEKNT